MTSPSSPGPLDTVRRLAPQCRVFGELGRAGDDDVWFLAREGGDESLIALRLQRRGVDEWGDPRYQVTLARTVGSDVPTNHGSCSACGASLRSFARFCGQCGADQSEGVRTGTSPDDRAALLADVRAAAAGAYEVLGEMPQAEGGGVVYFALDRTTDELVQLRLRQGVGGMDLKETRTRIMLDHLVTAPKGPGPAIRIRAQASEPAPPDHPSPPSGSPRPDRERRLTYAVIGLGVIVVVETALLLFS